MLLAYVGARLDTERAELKVTEGAAALPEVNTFIYHAETYMFWRPFMKGIAALEVNANGDACDCVGLSPLRSSRRQGGYGLVRKQRYGQSPIDKELKCTGYYVDVY